MLTAKCIDDTHFEWLLKRGTSYDVLSWTDDTVVIFHPACGQHGMDRKRFVFDPPKNHNVIDWNEYKRFGRVRYLNEQAMHHERYKRYF